MLYKDLSFDRTVQLLIESNTFYLVKIDEYGNYVFMNNHFINRHRSFYNEKDIRPASLALHPDDHELSYSTYLKCIANPEKSFGTTLRKLDGKGGYIITYWEYKADYLPDGKAGGVVGIGYDVTAFESRKEHLKFLTETLSNLANQQSHDVRRPLANVLGLVEVLKMLGEENHLVKEIAEKLSQSCVELNQEFENFLIRDLNINGK